MAQQSSKSQASGSISSPDAERSETLELEMPPPNAELADGELEIVVYADCFAEQLVRLWELVFAEDPKRNAPMLLIQRKLQMQPELFLLGVVDGRVVASVMGGYDGVRGWMYHLATDPAYRRRGYAAKLVRDLERRLKQLGCPKLNLQVRAGNESVTAFYQALGYVVEPRISLGKAL